MHIRRFALMPAIAIAALCGLSPAHAQQAPKPPMVHWVIPALESNMPVISPVTGIMKNEPMPRGAIATPASSGEYPSSVCSMIGSSTRLPYSTKPRTVIRKTPTA